MNLLHPSQQYISKLKCCLQIPRTSIPTQINDIYPLTTATGYSEGGAGIHQFLQTR